MAQDNTKNEESTLICDTCKKIIDGQLVIIDSVNKYKYHLIETITSPFGYKGGKIYTFNHCIISKW